MASPGYVYALINPSMPGLVKVGRTTRNPKDRALELSGATGVPTAFVVVYHEGFADCEEAEANIHLMLQREGLRVSSNREFFNAEISDVIKTIAACPGKASPVELTNIGDDQSPRCTNEQDIIKSLLEEANNFYLGIGGELQDYKEALRILRQAAQLWSGDAWFMIGMMHKLGNGTLENTDLALDAFKEAVRHGDISGYIQMAKIFSSRQHEDNFKKCWSKFFTECDDNFDDSTELYSYFLTHQNMGWKIEDKDTSPILWRNRNEIRRAGAEMMKKYPTPTHVVFRETDAVITRLLFPEEPPPQSRMDNLYLSALALIREECKWSTERVTVGLGISHNDAMKLLLRLMKEGIVGEPLREGIVGALPGEREVLDCGTSNA